MQKFSYKRPIDPQDVIIEKPKKKINRQQRIFTSVFVILFGLVIWYFAKDLFVVSFDGNVISYHGESHVMDDIFLLDVKVEPGDIVNPGDTMLCFLYTNMLYTAMNSTVFSDFQQKLFALNMSKKESLLELKTILEQKIALQKLENRVARNITLGISTTGEKINYAIEIEKTKQKLSYTKQIIELYNNSIDSLNVAHGQYLKDVLDPFEVTNQYMNNNMDRFGDMLQYLVAPEKILILAINKYPSNVVFKKDPIMLIYPIDEGAKRIHIEMIVKPRFLNEMQDGESVEIYFGGEYIGDGTIKINNTYMRSVRPIKLGQFSAEREGAIIRVNIDKPEELSLKYQIGGLPVKLRYKRKWDI